MLHLISATKAEKGLPLTRTDAALDLSQKAENVLTLSKSPVGNVHADKNRCCT